MTKIQNSKHVLVIEYWNLKFVCDFSFGVPTLRAGPQFGAWSLGFHKFDLLKSPIALFLLPAARCLLFTVFAFLSLQSSMKDTVPSCPAVLVDFCRSPDLPYRIEIRV